MWCSQIVIDLGPMDGCGFNPIGFDITPGGGARPPRDQRPDFRSRVSGQDITP